MAETMSNQVGDPYDPYTCMSHSSDRHNRRARLSPKNASKVSADAVGVSLVCLSLLMFLAGWDDLVTGDSCGL